MYAYEKFAARPTLDIDFLGNNISNEGTSIVAAFKEICSVPCDEDGVIYDIGFGDVVTPSPIDLDYPTLPESLPAVNILAYSLKAVIAEKFHAVVELAAKQPHEILLRPISSAVKRKI